MARLDPTLLVASLLLPPVASGCSASGQTKAQYVPACAAGQGDDCWLLGEMWMRKSAPTYLDGWDLLVDPNDSHQTAAATDGTSRIASQFWRANVNPSDRYALSLPGSSAYRISPLDTTYDNLTIAGDWTDCGFNGGCVEAAVMSGRLAAHALSKLPSLEDIVGFDHP